MECFVGGLAPEIKTGSITANGPMSTWGTINLGGRPTAVLFYANTYGGMVFLNSDGSITMAYHSSYSESYNWYAKICDQGIQYLVQEPGATAVLRYLAIM